MHTLQELRLMIGLSQIELSVKANVSVGAIQRAESGKPIQKTSLILLCQALGVEQKDVTGVNLYTRVQTGKETRNKTK